MLPGRFPKVPRSVKSPLTGIQEVLHELLLLCGVNELQRPFHPGANAVDACVTRS